MCPGICKDRLADAFKRFGRVPIEKRKVRLPPGHPALDVREEPFWSAGGLIHDGHGQVLLVRHSREKGWGDAWVTPGGLLEQGETVLDGLRREVREEVGLEVAEPRLTRILQQTLTDGVRTRPGYFAQIVARAESATARPGPDVVEARWFDHLPENLAFRDDYVTDFARFVRGATF
ncbi:MAG TPA: NUDIX hydrolase [Thermoplasmata archaeon]|nr:NUDIX hydrolase [Thermoplasmata archaeon]